MSNTFNYNFIPEETIAFNSIANTSANCRYRNTLLQPLSFTNLSPELFPLYGLGQYNYITIYVYIFSTDVNFRKVQ